MDDTPCSKHVHGNYWEDCYPAKTPMQTWCPPDVSSAVKAPGSTTKLTLFDQSAKKIGPPQRLVGQKTPITATRHQHSTAKYDTGNTVTKPRSQVKHTGARLREDQENDLCKAFGAAVRTPCDPSAEPLAMNMGTCEKARDRPFASQQPGTPSMHDSIRRYDFVKRALEESTNKETDGLQQRQPQQPCLAKPGSLRQPVGSILHQGVQHDKLKQQQAEEQERLGRRDTYAAVRTNKVTREETGGSMAITPVRRSARKPHRSEQEADDHNSAHLHDHSVAALLESTNFCYTPNKELTPLLYGHGLGNKAGQGTEGKQLRF